MWVLRFILVVENLLEALWWRNFIRTGFHTDGVSYSRIFIQAKLCCTKFCETEDFMVEDLLGRSYVGPDIRGSGYLWVRRDSYYEDI